MFLTLSINLSILNILKVNSCYFENDFSDLIGSKMVSKLDKQTFTSGFDSHWVSHSFRLVPNRSKKLRKLPLRKGHSGISTCRVDASSSSSSCHAISTDIPDPLSPPLPIVHYPWQVFRATSSIHTELLYKCSSWASCLCSSLWRGPQEYITYELVPTSAAVSCMSGSSNFDSFHDKWKVQLLFGGVVLPPGLV